METMRAIITRRSTRRFQTTQEFSEETVMDLLRAATSAPSEDGAKPWCFIVVKNEKSIRNLAILLKAPDTLQSAGMAIVVCADTMKQDQMGHWVVDCAAATENVVLAAHDKELGSTWARIFPSKKRMKMIGDLFKTPQHITAFSAVFLGKPEKALNRRAAPLQTKEVHVEKW